MCWTVTTFPCRSTPAFSAWLCTPGRCATWTVSKGSCFLASSWVWPMRGPSTRSEVRKRGQGDGFPVLSLPGPRPQWLDHSTQGHSFCWATLSHKTTGLSVFWHLPSPHVPSGFLVVMTLGCCQPVSCWSALGLPILYCLVPLPKSSQFRWCACAIVFLQSPLTDTRSSFIGWSWPDQQEKWYNTEEVNGVALTVRGAKSWRGEAVRSTAGEELELAVWELASVAHVWQLKRCGEFGGWAEKKGATPKYCPIPSANNSFHCGIIFFPRETSSL